MKKVESTLITFFNRKTNLPVGYMSQKYTKGEPIKTTLVAYFVNGVQYTSKKETIKVIEENENLPFDYQHFYKKVEYAVNGKLYAQYYVGLDFD